MGEEGIYLSGCQKQMIAFAMILYKEPQFLVLDASTAMDIKMGKCTKESLQKIKNECAMLFISPKLQPLKTYADEIYVLEEKTLTASGNRERLIQSSNFYTIFG